MLPILTHELAQRSLLPERAEVSVEGARVAFLSMLSVPPPLVETGPAMDQAIEDAPESEVENTANSEEDLADLIEHLVQTDSTDVGGDSEAFVATPRAETPLAREVTPGTPVPTSGLSDMSPERASDMPRGNQGITVLIAQNPLGVETGTLTQNKLGASTPATLPSLIEPSAPPPFSPPATQDRPSLAVMNDTNLVTIQATPVRENAGIPDNLRTTQNEHQPMRLVGALSRTDTPFSRGMIGGHSAPMLDGGPTPVVAAQGQKSADGAYSHTWQPTSFGQTPRQAALPEPPGLSTPNAEPARAAVGENRTYAATEATPDQVNKMHLQQDRAVTALPALGLEPRAIDQTPMPNDTPVDSVRTGQTSGMQLDATVSSPASLLEKATPNGHFSQERLDPADPIDVAPLQDNRFAAASDRPTAGIQNSNASAYAQGVETNRSIANQIATTVSANGDTAFDIALQPEELGRVRLQLISSDAGHLLIIQAERPETLDLMRRHVSQLEQDLAALGFEGLSLRFGGENPSGPQQRPDAKPAHNSSVASSNQPEISPSAQTQTASAPHLLGQERLDIRL